MRPRFTGGRQQRRSLSADVGYRAEFHHDLLVMRAIEVATPLYPVKPLNILSSSTGPGAALTGSSLIQNNSSPLFSTAFSLTR